MENLWLIFPIVQIFKFHLWITGIFQRDATYFPRRMTEYQTTIEFIEFINTPRQSREYLQQSSFFTWSKMKPGNMWKNPENPAAPSIAATSPDSKTETDRERERQKDPKKTRDIFEIHQINDTTRWRPISSTKFMNQNFENDRRWFKNHRKKRRKINKKKERLK